MCIRDRVNVAGEQSAPHPGHKYHRKLDPLGRMNGHHLDLLLQDVEGLVLVNDAGDIASGQLIPVLMTYFVGGTEQDVYKRQT